MMTREEELFATFSVSDRLAVIEAMQRAIVNSADADHADRCEDFLTRVGYPQSASTARQWRVENATLTSGASIVDRIAEYSGRV